jgi:hypothetical protein
LTPVLDVPEVRCVRDERGAIAYQVWATAISTLLFMTEWATSLDNAWSRTSLAPVVGPWMASVHRQLVASA